MIKYNNKILNITAAGSFIMMILTPGLPGVVWAFIFGLALGQLIRNKRIEKNEEL
jgi:hypothetical protein